MPKSKGPQFVVYVTFPHIAEVRFLRGDGKLCSERPDAKHFTEREALAQVKALAPNARHEPA